MKIVFLHGLVGSSHNFDELSKYFPNSKAIDIIGFASAEKPETTYDKELFINYLEKYINKKCIIIGHSMGAIIAKDFAIKHPELVEQIYLLSYPLQKDQYSIEKILNKDIWVKLYMSNSSASHFFCSSKNIWKYPFLLLISLFAKKHYLSARDYFKHNYNSVYSSTKDYIEKDNWTEINVIKDKAVFITGQNDFYADKTLLKNFQNFTIPKMGHMFFGYEEKIAKIIKEDIKTNLHINL